MLEIGLVDFKSDGCVLMFPIENSYRKSKHELVEFWVYVKYKTWLPEYPQIPLPLFMEWWDD